MAGAPHQRPYPQARRCFAERHAGLQRVAATFELERTPKAELASRRDYTVSFSRRVLSD